MLTRSPLITTINPTMETKVEVFGVPFDATSTFRTGSRFAPDAIRNAFLNIEVYSPEKNVNLETVTMHDLGNLERTSHMQHLLEDIETTVKEIIKRNHVPIILGGEHTLTHASFAAMPDDAALLVFDAHLDLRNEYDHLSMMHATHLRRTVEKRKNPQIIHIGARAATEEEWRFAKKNNMLIIPSQDILQGNTHLDEFKTALAKITSLYVSIDLDVLDPAFGPGVANPEACGLSSWQVLTYLHLLQGGKIAGIDIVELCPQYDASGITAIAAAKFLAELCYQVYSNK